MPSEQIFYQNDQLGVMLNVEAAGGISNFNLELLTIVSRFLYCPLNFVLSLGPRKISLPEKTEQNTP